LGDSDKNILFLVSFSMGHFNSLFLLLRVQIFNLLFLSPGSDCVLWVFFYIDFRSHRGISGYGKLSAFVAGPNYWGMSYKPVETLGWAGFWEMVGFSFLFSILFHFSLVIEIRLSSLARFSHFYLQLVFPHVEVEGSEVG